MNDLTSGLRAAVLPVVLGLLLGAATHAGSREESNFSLAVFVADVTPPIDHPLQAGMGGQAVGKVDDPLLAHGFVLLGLEKPLVLVSIDWCGIGNEAHDLWREKLAQAARTNRERVLVSAVHQHDAPLVDLEAQRSIAATVPDRSTVNVQWHSNAVARVADSLKRSLAEAKPITRIGIGEAKVEKIASNRRLVGPDGKVVLWRGSAMTDPKAKELPEGLIDPWLKTISFWNGEKALASLSVYATHPMSYYGKGRVSADFVGLARRRRQNDDPGVTHFFANGCAGDVAAGKYNRGAPEDRERLADRLYTAWKAAWQNTKKHPLGTVQFRSTPLVLDPKKSDGFARNRLEAIRTGKNTPYEERVRAAYAVSWQKRCETKRGLDMPAIDLGAAVLLLLPGEPFVEYQLFAQRQRPESTVLALGYGDYGPVYIPTDKAFDEGGYEVGGWSFVAPGTEKSLKSAIRKGVLADALPEGSRLHLAAQGKSPFVIVTPPGPSAEEAAAAGLLAGTLEKATGASLPVRSEDAADLPKTLIRLRQSTALEPEAWAIRTTRDGLILAGGRPRGLFYAVCEFLETHVGVYRFDPFTTVVPRRPDLSLPAIDRRGKPAFEARTMFTGFPYTHAATDAESVRRFHVWNKNNLYGSLAEGDWLRHVPDGAHTFGKFLSAKEFAKEHPEYFSMDAAGKRMTDDKGSGILWIQLCVTNDDVRRIVLERARKALRDDAAEATRQGRSPAPYLVISQNDNTTDLCLCPKCKAISQREGSQSGLLLDFVNFVARGVRDEFPDVLVLTEAYNYTLHTPKTVRPEPNVIVRYCDNYGFSDPTRPLADPFNARPNGLFEAWTKAAPRLAVWDYWRVYQMHAPGFFAPSVNTRAIREDLQRFRRHGIRYLTLELEDFLGAGIDAHPMSCDLQSFTPLRTWVGVKLLDDPDRDTASLVEIFCRGYFGPAAEAMRQLHDGIAARQARVPLRVVDVQRHVWVHRLCDAEFFITAYRHLDAAEGLAKDDSAVRTRVARERLVIDSAYLWTEEGVRRAHPASAAQLPKRRDVLNRHRQDWQAYLAATFDAEGQRKIRPLVDRGLRVMESLRPEDTDNIAEARLVKGPEIVVDGRRDEAVWNTARPQRLVPRNPDAPNDDPSQIRFAWSPEALYLCVEQRADNASAIVEVSLIEFTRKTIQLSLHCRRDGTVSSYFHRFGADGNLEQLKDRKTKSVARAARNDRQAAMEVCIPWSDLDVRPNAGSEFYLNIATYPKLDSPSPTYLSSPWLIGDSPTWHPAYYALLRLTGSCPPENNR